MKAGPQDIKPICFEQWTIENVPWIKVCWQWCNLVASKFCSLLTSQSGNFRTYKSGSLDIWQAKTSGLFSLLARKWKTKNGGCGNHWFCPEFVWSDQTICISQFKKKIIEQVTVIFTEWAPSLIQSIFRYIHVSVIQLFVPFCGTQNCMDWTLLIKERIAKIK